MKFAVRFLLTLFVIVAGTILVLPSLLDWNALKPQIEARLEKELGRDVTLGGSIKASFLPEPHLEADDVTIANVQGGEAPNLLHLKSLQGQIAFAPLLSGRVVVKGLRLVEPVLTIERMSDGKFNFSFASAADPASDHMLAQYERVQAVTSGRAFRLDPQTISLDKVEIVKGTLIYRDHILDATETVSALDGVLSAKTLAGPYSGEAGFAWQGRRWGLNGDIATPGADGQRPLTVKLTEPSATLKASLIGRIGQAADDQSLPWRVSGALILRADRPEEFWQKEPASPARPLALEGAFQLDPAAGDVKDIALRWGDFTGSGALHVDLAKGISYSLTASGRALDLDALLPPLPADAPAIWPLAVFASVAPAQTPDAPPAPAPRSLFSSVLGQIDLKLTSLTYRKKEIASLALVAEESSQGLNINSASATLPGKSDLTLSGLVRSDNYVPHFIGSIGIASEEARTLLEWCGFSVAAVSKDRLGRLAFRGGVDFAPGYIDFLNFQAGLDGAQVRGFLGLNRSGTDGQPTMNGQLNATRINLAPYRGLFAQDDKRSMLDILSEGVENMNGVLVFDIDSLAAGDIDAQGVWGKLELKSGQLSFNTLTVENILGTRIICVGDVLAPGGRSTAGLRGEFSGEDMRPLLSHFGLAAPKGKQPIGPYGFRADMSVQSGSGQIIIDGAISGAQMILTVDLNTVEAPFAWRLGDEGSLETTLAFESERATELGTLLGFGEETGSLDAPSSVSLRYSNSVDRKNLSLSAMVGQDVARLSWRQDGDAKTGHVALDLDAKSNDLALALSSMGASQEWKTTFPGPFTLHIAGDGPAGEIAVKTLDYRLSSEHIEGQGTLDISGARPKGDLTLETSHLDLDRYFSLFQRSLVEYQGGWRDVPLQLAPLKSLDGRIALKSDALGLANMTLENVTLDASLDDGTLSLKNVKANWNGGALTANATLRGGDTLPGYALSTKFADVDSAQLGAFLFAKPFSKGPVSGSVLLKSQGATPLALAAATSGQIALKGGEGQVEGFDLAAFDSRRKKLRKGEAAAPVLGALTGGNSVVQAADLAFTVDQGIAHANSGIVDLDQGRAVLTGQIDIAKRVLDLDLNLPANGLPATPHLKIGGTLDAPKTELALNGVADALTAEAAARPVEVAPPPPEPVVTPPPPPPPAAPDRLRSLIEALPSKTQ